MNKIISACGNNCSVCPRHLPKNKQELLHTAELWYKIGYRDTVVSKEEISCSGCKATNFCRYNIINCTTQKCIANCGLCPDYPCDIIISCFNKTADFIPACKKACTEDEYSILEEAFFSKKENLDEIRNEAFK